MHEQTIIIRTIHQPVEILVVVPQVLWAAIRTHRRLKKGDRLEGTGRLEGRKI